MGYFFAKAVTAASPPAYGSEIASTRLTETSSNATSVLTVTSSVATSTRVVVIISWVSATQTLTSVTDSQGNTWTIDKNYLYATNNCRAICSANITSALSNTNTITAHWGSPGFTFRGMAAFAITGTNTSSAVDLASTGATAFNTSPSNAGTTTATQTLCIGVVSDDLTSITYSSSAWTVVGSTHDFGATSNRNYYVYKAAAAAGSQNPLGTMSSNTTWGVVWVAYKA